MSRPTFHRSCVFSLAVLFCLAASLPLLADSHVRIVRLSYIDGGVQVSHGDGQAYQSGIVNLPIAEGMKLKTSDEGRAEVEFEDGSTLRLAPDSAVDFQQLSLQDSGVKVSTVMVTQGTAYVNFVGSKDSDLTVGFGNEKVALTHAAHLRIDLAGKDSSVSVFKGLIQVDGPAGSMQVKKNQSLTFNAAENDQSKLAKNVREEPWDEWDDQQNEYHSRYAMKSYDNYSPFAYGTTDLAYYGNFFNYPGYGMVWQPFFAGAGWDPFMNGAWAFSPGFGYGWVSAYPWGWTPFHYGSWAYLQGRGWAWQPGGAWRPVYTQLTVRNAPRGFAPPQAPNAGMTNRTVFVNRGTASTFAGNRLVLRNNSAGLGVPRGELGNMSKLSRKVETHGVVNRQVYTQPVGMRSNAGWQGRGPASSGPARRPSNASAGRAASAPRMSTAAPRSSGMSAPSARSAPSGGPQRH